MVPPTEADRTQACMPPPPPWGKKGRQTSFNLLPQGGQRRVNARNEINSSHRHRGDYITPFAPPPPPHSPSNPSPLFHTTQSSILILRTAPAASCPPPIRQMRKQLSLHNGVLHRSQVLLHQSAPFIVSHKVQKVPSIPRDPARPRAMHKERGVSALSN